MPGRVPPVRPAGSQISARPSPPPRCPHVANKLLPTGWPVPIAARNLLHPGWPVPTIRSPPGRSPPLPLPSPAAGRRVRCEKRRGRLVLARQPGTPAAPHTLAGPVPKVRKFSEIRARRKLNLARWLSGPFLRFRELLRKRRERLVFAQESPAPWLGRCRKSENFPTRKK
ncbi:hypothetical protein MIMGU_mgv11b019631mg [Erythranthe guttata]|uniref:Uncharacterized protein n=1 Tax=Erythranthe guttata TaxID=4155 RepID=A0A022Q378_ERYGU|nr:hypothetical protein MIMGU_mgv11b019631mg [Erythranthe guttata]